MNLLSCCPKGSLHSWTITSCRVLAIRYNSSAQSKTHYQTLGVPRTASVKEIKAAYIELCKKHHPDANPNDPQAQQRFVKLQEAYNVLSSPVERACYDVKINRASYKTPNYGSARSSDADFIRKYYQEKAREHQRQKDMEDWRYRTGKYRDHDMDEALRKENERQRQAFQNIFQSGAGRNLRNDRYWSGRYQYHYYHSSHPGGILRRMMFHLILWTCFFSLIGTRH